jgi:hypothetical protein
VICWICVAGLTSSSLARVAGKRKGYFAAL